MKTIKLFISLVLFSLIGTIGVNAQGRYGADSANCVRYLNFYRDYCKQNNLKEAAPLWQKAIKSCPPTASQNMLVDGSKILKYLMQNYKEGTPEYNAYVDSLLLMNDLRVQYYPKYALRAKENKAFDCLNYLKDDKKIYDVVLDAVNCGGNNANITLLVALMDKVKSLYQSNAITEDAVLSDYAKYSEIIQRLVDADPTEQNKGALVVFENAFITSGVASCENLIKLFGPRFNENQSDLALVKSIVKVLADRECLQSELYLAAVEKMHELEPSFNSAYYLYKLYAFNKEEEKAMKMLNDALNYSDITKDKKGELLMELATYTFKKQLGAAKAVNFAKEAIETDPAQTAKAYFLIATIWANQKCTGNEVQTRAKYWVATDYLMKAKAQDPSIASEADNLIRQYRQYFPQAADAFMYDVVDGASYTVSCGGLSATTTVRTIK